jgi:hypothetical protein
VVARIRVRDLSGTLQTVKRIRVRDADGVLRTIRRVRGRDTTGTLRTFWEALYVEVSPLTADGYIAGSTTQNVDTGSVLATATGGLAPYSYAWTAVGSSPYTWVISAPAAATTYFTAQSVPVGAVATNIFRVTVTDSLGAVAAWDVYATARNNNTLSGGGSGEGYTGGDGPAGVFNPPRDVN